MPRLFIPFLLAASAAVAHAQEKITWQDHIRPIFENRCNNCHNADKKKGGLDLSTYPGVIAGGSGGASVEAGDSAASTLWKVVSHTSEPVMPPKGDKIPHAEIDLIAKWIMGGLLDTPDGTVKVKKKASFAMSATASTARPEGPPPMPEHLLLDPVVTPARPNAVVALAHSPWAPLAALAAPRQVLLYQSTTGDLLGVLPFPDGGTPETLSFSRNGALLLAGGGIAGKQGTVVAWEVKTGNAVINLSVKEDSDTILAADISADLTKVAVGGPGRRVRIYDTRTSQLLANIKKHTDWVTALSFSPDGVLLASGDRNGGLYIWEAASGSEFHNLRAHEKMIASLAWRGDSNLVAAGSEDGNFTWWEMANGTQVKKVGSHGGVLALGFAPDGRLVSGGRDGHVRIWDGNGAQQKDWVPSGGSPVLETIFTDDGKRVLSGTWNGELKSWDAAAPEAPPAILTANPPSIETRLAALDQETATRRTAAGQAEATLTEKENAAAAQEAALTSLKQAIAAMPEREKAAAARAAELAAARAKLNDHLTALRQELEATDKSLASPPPAPAAPTNASTAPEIKAVLEQAAAAETSLANLSRAVAEKKAAALRKALEDGNAALSKHDADIAQATKVTEQVKAEMAALSQKMPEHEKAMEAMKQQAAAAKAALDGARAEAENGLRALARWKAARQQKAALALRAEARALKEKLDSVKEELTPLEANVSTAPTGPQAERLTALRKELETLPAAAEAKQKAAEAAWQDYLNQLPK